MTTADILIWIVFLGGAPALLWWLYQSNRQRTRALAAWAQARGWSFHDRDETLRTVLTAIPFTYGKRHTAAEVMRGPSTDREALSWRHMRSTIMAGGRKHTSWHVVGLRLTHRAPAIVQLVPNALLQSLPAGPVAEAQLATGDTLFDQRWRAYTNDAAALPRLLPPTARDTLRDWTTPPDLIALRAEGDLLVGWFPGEPRVERIDPTLDVLHRWARAIER